MQRTRTAALHHLVVALLVGGDKDDLGPEAVPHLAEQLDRVRPASPLLRVPQDHALGRDVLVDEPRYRRSESLFLVGPDPDEEPVANCVNISRKSNKNEQKQAYQFGLWMQVDKAAPIPVPVQIRMPRLNMAEACPTPAIPC